MKNQKEIRAFEVIALAVIIVTMLSQISDLLLIISNSIVAKGSDVPGIHYIVKIITALSPIIILYLIYDYSKKNCGKRYSPGMNRMIVGSIVLVMSIRVFAQYPKQIYEVSKLLGMMPDHPKLMIGVIVNGLAMATAVIGCVIGMLLLRRGYRLAHETTASEALFKTSEILQITLPVGFGVLILTLFEKGETLASEFIPKMIYDQTLLNTDLYWTIAEVGLSIILVYVLYRYCKAAAVLKYVRRESYLFAGGILLIHEAGSILFYLIISFSLIMNRSSHAIQDIERIPIALNTISLLFFIMKVIVGIWYLRNSRREDSGFQVMP